FVVGYAQRGRSFFFEAAATPAIYTLSLHDALPIYETPIEFDAPAPPDAIAAAPSAADERRQMMVEEFSVDTTQHYLQEIGTRPLDRKSTRLNSSHVAISYAVFCLKKKTKEAADIIH